MKMGEIWRAKPALDRLFSDGVKGIPSSVGIRLAILSRQIDEKYLPLERERIRLIKIYGEQGERGNISIPPERQGEFYDEFAPHLDAEVPSLMPEKIKLPDVEIPLDILKALEPFIEIGG